MWMVWSVLCDFMNASIPIPAELELVPGAAKPSEAARAKEDSAMTREAIEVRTTALTPVMESILEIRPSSRWGINE